MRGNKSLPNHCRASGRARHGAVLVEFALVALVMYLLLAAILEFGRMFYCAQTVQAAADFAARELSRTPLSPVDVPTLEIALGTQVVRETVYTEDYLAIDVSEQAGDLIEYLDSLDPPVPPVNMLLVPVMFVDQVGDRRILRYPGALVTSPTAPSGYTVRFPSSLDSAMRAASKPSAG